MSDRTPKSPQNRKTLSDRDSSSEQVDEEVKVHVKEARAKPKNSLIERRSNVEQENPRSKKNSFVERRSRKTNTEGKEGTPRPMRLAPFTGRKHVEERYEEGLMYGLAFCHREDQRDLLKIFPEVATPIRWKYLDILGNPSANQIIGSMYEPGVLREVSLGKRGYDYVVIPNCPIGPFNLEDKVLLYTLTSPLIAASCLLGDNGICISNNFVSFASQYCDTVEKDKVREAKRQIEVGNFSLAEEYIHEDGMEVSLSGNLIHDKKVLNSALQLAYKRQIYKLINEEDDLATKIDKLANTISYLAGYKSFERYPSQVKDDISISFFKGET